MQRVLDFVEVVGNRVPHPAVIFLMLIAIVVVLSHVMEMMGVTVNYQVINEDTYELETETTKANSLLTASGIRFIYASLISNFMGFSAVGLMIVAMIGAGVAEEAGLVQALIRKLVILSPRAILVYILVFVGILSSVGADAGYLVLIPLAGTAFLSIGRHPLAGLAAGFAAVAGAFTVNMLIKPLDAVLTEFTNDAIHLVDPSRSIGLTANLWFSLVSVPFLTVIITLVTERIIEPRLGTYTGEKPEETGGALTPAESKGLLYAGFALLGVLVFFGLLTLPPGAPLRDPASGAIIGNSPFMQGLIAVIMVLFLATGIAYGIGAGTITKTNDVINAITKAISGLGGTIFLLLIISQFVAYFNHTNMGTILAIKMANVLKDANVGPIWLLLGLIGVVALLDFLITGAIAKWAIFAPIFVPVLVKLGVDPEAALAAYRIGDSPVNMITPLNVYFAMVVGFAQKYDKNAGVGTIVSLMLPYVFVIFFAWTLLFVAWYLIGLPWGI
ncbi:MAG: p-aminobenzoyl-glutamate transporter [Planctomyces sp.]|jgi:aminobenzoyl-glutamate transport protein|nr:p-aminobenzoyl-glutamate transporter [Planctomyces sp.]